MFQQFYAEILVILAVLIHIQSQQKSGLVGATLSNFENFEQGLFRYMEMVVLRDNNAEILKKLHQHQWRNKMLREEIKFDQFT